MTGGDKDEAPTLGGNWGDGGHKTYFSDQSGQILVGEPAGEEDTPGLSLGRTFASEGGFDQNMERLSVAANSIMNAVSMPAAFSTSFDNFSEGVQAKVFDTLRIDPKRGGAEAALIALEDNLTGDEYRELKGWLDKLPSHDRDVIRSWLNGEFE